VTLRSDGEAGPNDGGGAIYLADLDQPGKGPAKKFTHLLNPRSSWKTGAHIHPFLSPDGTMGFFNSDVSGLLQAYMLRGLPPAVGSSQRSG
jgi:Tol biopolymer transport system component